MDSGLSDIEPCRQSRQYVLLGGWNLPTWFRRCEAERGQRLSDSPCQFVNGTWEDDTKGSCEFGTDMHPWTRHYGCRYWLEQGHSLSI